MAILSTVNLGNLHTEFGKKNFTLYFRNKFHNVKYLKFVCITLDLHTSIPGLSILFSSPFLRLLRLLVLFFKSNGELSCRYFYFVTSLRTLLQDHSSPIQHLMMKMTAEMAATTTKLVLILLIPGCYCHGLQSRLCDGSFCLKYVVRGAGHGNCSRSTPCCVALMTSMRTSTQVILAKNRFQWKVFSMTAFMNNFWSFPTWGWRIWLHIATDINSG